MGFYMKHLAILLSACVVSIVTASAQPIPGSVKTAAFLEVTATRGLECGLLRPWQASALRALNLRDMENWNADRGALLATEVERSIAETSCDDEAMQAWINGARPGFDREFLPPYLIVYRTLVGYEDPPKVFSRTAVRLRYLPVIEAINAKLAAIEASGAVAEGGKSWPDSTKGVQEHARGFVATLTNPEASLAERDEAAGWIAQSAHIVELWFLDEER